MAATQVRGNTQIINATVTDVQVAAANKDGAAGTASMRTLGSGAAQAAAGNHTHAGSNFSDSETPSGSINGSNVTFTLAHSPSPGASLMLFQNGILLQVGASNDYTLSTNTITMATAPQTNDILVCWYRY